MMTKFNVYCKNGTAFLRDNLTGEIRKVSSASPILLNKDELNRVKNSIDALASVVYVEQETVKEENIAAPTVYEDVAIVDSSEDEIEVGVEDEESDSTVIATLNKLYEELRNEKSKARRKEIKAQIQELAEINK